MQVIVGDRQRPSIELKMMPAERVRRISDRENTRDRADGLGLMTGIKACCSTALNARCNGAGDTAPRWVGTAGALGSERILVGVDGAPGA